MTTPISRTVSLLLEPCDAAVLVRLYHTKAGAVLIVLHRLCNNGDIRLFLDMVFQKLVVIKLVNTVAGRNHNIWLVAVAQEGKILRDRIRRRQLIEMIEKAMEEDRTDFVKDVLVRYIDLKRIYSYEMTDYWSNIASVEFETRLFFTTAPGLYFAGGRSSILE